MAMDRDSEDEDKQGEATEKISKKKLKKQSRLTVAELKQIVERPDLVSENKENKCFTSKF